MGALVKCATKECTIYEMCAAVSGYLLLYLSSAPRTGMENSAMYSVHTLSQTNTTYVTPGLEKRSANQVTYSYVNLDHLTLGYFFF
jgi:hypothetical protein